MTTDERIVALTDRGYHVITADRGHDWRVMVLRDNRTPQVHYGPTRDEAVASAHEAVCGTGGAP